VATLQHLPAGLFHQNGVAVRLPCPEIAGGVIGHCTGLNLLLIPGGKSLDSPYGLEYRTRSNSFSVSLAARRQASVGWMATFGRRLALPGSADAGQKRMGCTLAGPVCRPSADWDVRVGVLSSIIRQWWANRNTTKRVMAPDRRPSDQMRGFLPPSGLFSASGGAFTNLEWGSGRVRSPAPR
jgi:hypothetical protein